MFQNKLLSFLKTFLDPGKFAKIILVATLALYFSFGSYRLAKFVTADEHYWIYERIPQYWKALSEGKFKKTLINDKPGVTTAIISGFGLIFEKDTGSHLAKIDEDLKLYEISRTENMNAAFRYPVLIFNGFFIFYFFWIISKITGNKWIALWTSIFIGLSPILIGMSQIVNPDSFLWTFGCAAIFSYFASLKHEQKKYVFLTALFTGLAILSKYTANILFPFYLFSLFIRFITDKKIINTGDAKKYFKLHLLNYLFIVVGALFTMSLFLPAIFVKPVYLYRLTLGFSSMNMIFGIILALIMALYIDLRLLNSRVALFIKKFLARNVSWIKLVIFIVLIIFLALIIGRNLFAEWKLFDIVPFDIKNISYIDNAGYHPNLAEKLLLEFNPLVFSLTPLVLLLTIFIWARLILAKKYEENDFYVFLVTFFIFVYFGASIVSDVVAMVRYSIILYPLVALLAAFGLWSAYDLWLKKIRFNARPMLTLAIFILSMPSLIFIKPFYFNYTNFLLPKSEIISDAWGYGGYEAARFLNALPGAENTTIWSDYYGVCEFFVGKCLTDYNMETGQYSPKYFVLTRRGKIRYFESRSKWMGETGINAVRYYDDPNPLWKIEIGDRPDNYIKILKADNELRSSIITDIDHCPSRAPVATDQLDNFINFSQEKKADFVISLGDNASHRLRNCSETADADARFVAEYLRTSEMPAYFVLGDHDIESNAGSYQNWLETAKRDETFYSFHLKNVHVIVLDTVLGGEPMSQPCEQDAECLEAIERSADLKSLSFDDYRQKYPSTETALTAEKRRLSVRLEDIDTRRNQTRSWGVRDRGRISDSELAWLQNDLDSTAKSKVLIFSDHPLFQFASSRKNYDIVNGDKVREILVKSEKEIVAISGEAHLWYEEKQSNIQYYIIDEFRKANGSWAYFTWDDDGFSLAKETH